ncbi:AAA family ATPase [Desulfofundulus kuznetsovii]|uniref:AAA family ATPase n=1 Tax=Desulfofundulus kuznetsovii TaxID=58135 RepID=UPI00338D84D4
MVSEVLRDYLFCSKPGIIVRAQDITSTVKEIMEAVREIGNRPFYLWDANEGLRQVVNPDNLFIGKGNRDNTTAPVQALQKASTTKDAIAVFLDFHHYLTSPPVLSAMRTAFVMAEKHGASLVFVSRYISVPGELEREVAVVDCPVPGREQLREVLDRLLEKNGARIAAEIDDKQKELAVESALGLTVDEAKDAFAVSIVRTVRTEGRPRLCPRIISEQKRQAVARSGILEFVEPGRSLSDVGGLDEIKNWFVKRFKTFLPEAAEYGISPAKGCLLLGVPGCGKSLLARAVAGEWQKPLLRLDFGRVYGSLVGETEANLRRAIQAAEAVAPAVLWVDEAEKGLSGTASSGRTDSGVTSRVFGSFLTWLQEKTSPVLVIATANDITSLPAELLRRGRFDGIFFVDLPDERAREEIFKIHLAKRRRDPGKFDLQTLVAASEGYSGAEIESAVEDAMLEAFNEGREVTTGDLIATLKNVIPLSVNRRDEIERLRRWAEESGFKKTSGTKAGYGERLLRILGGGSIGLSD